MSIKQGGNTIAGAVGKYPLNERNISNCITNIPQDINLELSNGTLTLKAGSKVYVPNGAGVFDEITIASDLTLNGFGTGTRQMIVCYRNNVLDADPNSFSGTSTPSGSGFFYNTSTNKIDYVSSGTALGRTYSFPLCVVTFVDSAISSIDQVFNGFGYIGSTVFALPGVKGLIPNGRNADGSLKNTTTNDFTTVKTVQVNTSTAKIAMYSGGGLGSQTKNFGLNEPENYNYDSGILTNALEVASVIVNSSAKITSFTPKTVFHAVDYSDIEYIAHQAMPSGRYINLTLGSSGTNYTAPADGYVCFYMSQPGSHDLQVYLSNETAQVKTRTYQNTNDIACWIPVSKGDRFYLEYTYNSGSYQFRFVYANGAQ